MVWNLILLLSSVFVLLIKQLFFFFQALTLSEAVLWLFSIGALGAFIILTLEIQSILF